MDELCVIALESDTAPAELGGVYAQIESASIGDSGQVAFSASLADSAAASAILVHTGGATHAVLRSGAPTPIGGTYKRFLDIDFSESAQADVAGNHPFLLFRAELEGSAATEGLFLWTPAGVTAVALPGARSPHGHRYRSFAQLTVLAGLSRSGVTPLLAFVAHIEDGGKTVVIDPHVHAPLEPLTTGDRLGEYEVKNFVISRMGGLALNCVADVSLPRASTSCKEVLMINADALFWGELKEQVHFDGLGRVKRILTPPTIKFQEGYVALECEDGTSAIVRSDSLSDPILVAKTGDPIPGLPYESIQRFGPPEVNCHFPYATPWTVVVSTVELCGGQSALWSAIAFQGSPGQPGWNATRVLLREGERFGNEPGLIMRSFTPVKVNNHGAVLLRGAMDYGAAVRQGIFVMNQGWSR